MPNKFHTLVVGEFATNCYLFWNESGSYAIIIDPGAEADAIMAAVDDIGLEPRAILLTHGHGDHIIAVPEIKERYNIPLYAGAGEEELLASSSANMSSFFAKPVVTPAPEELVTDEQPLDVCGLKLRVLATPGHSPGGVCYLDEEDGILFCGDTLFAGSVGRTDFPGCSTELLLESIRKKILTLPDSIVCLPGHGPRTTVGSERMSNPFLIGGHFA